MENYQNDESLVSAATSVNGMGSFMSYLVMGLLTFGGGYILGAGTDSVSSDSQEIVVNDQAFEVQSDKCNKECKTHEDPDDYFDCYDKCTATMVVNDDDDYEFEPDSESDSVNGLPIEAELEVDLGSKVIGTP